MSNRSDPAISRDVALRVALAARALPGVGVRQLLGALIVTTGGTLTRESLTRVSARRLRAAIDVVPPPSNAQVGRAVSALRAPLPPAARAAPRAAAYREGDLPQSIRVACCSNEGMWLDGELSTCERLLIYQVSTSEFRLIDVRTPLQVTASVGKLWSGPSKPWGVRVAMLKDCLILYTLSVGTPARAALVRSGVHVVRLHQPLPCPNVMRRLQRVLANSPPPWLAKATKAGAAYGPLKQPGTVATSGADL